MFVCVRVVQWFRVVKIRVKVVYSDGFPFRLVPQTTYCWGPSSFTDPSSSESSRISLMLLLLCHVGFAGVCCRLCIPPSLLFCGLLHSLILCPGLAHPKHKLLSLRLLYSLLDRLSCGLLRVASKSIASPPWVVVRGLKVPSFFLGVSFFLEDWTCLTMASLVSFSIAQLASLSVVVKGADSFPHASCSLGFMPASSHSPAVV